MLFSQALHKFLRSENPYIVCNRLPVNSSLLDSP